MSTAAAAAAAMSEELEAMRQEKRRKKHGEQMEVAVASSQSPIPPATPDSKQESPARVAAETLTSTAVAAAAAAAFPLMEEAVRKEENKRRKRSEHEEAAATPSPSVTAASQISEVAAEGATARKEWIRGKVEQEQSGQAPLPVGVHPWTQSVKRNRAGKIPVLSNREILRRRAIELKKQQSIPQGFFPAMANPNSIDQDTKYSAPLGAYFDQFRYIPDHPHREQTEVAVASSQSPRPPATPNSKQESPARVTAETLTSTVAAEATFPLVEEAVLKEGEKKCKRSKHEEAAATPSPSVTAASQISEVAAEGATARKDWRRGKVEQEQSSQPPLPVGVHPWTQSVERNRAGKIPVLSNREILRRRVIELKKQQSIPQGFFPAMANPNSIDQDTKYSLPLGAYFDQFRYIPDRPQGRNARSLPKAPDCPARPPPQDHPSSLSFQLSANKTVSAKITTSTRKQPHSASVSGTDEVVKVKEKKQPEKQMSRMKKPRKRVPSLSAAEQRSDKYRRLPLNQLVCPPRSPHKLLQENYAHDPWKVIVICILLNLTQGKQVSKKVEGFFERYPDAHIAYAADPIKMADYLTTLGLQRVKADRIKKFSKAYVEKEWTYITELCGVGKYAADAYAIFCAGRATEVVPEDHKLVDYWKYVCFELPLVEASQQNAQEAAEVTGQGNFDLEVQEIAAS